MLEEIVPGFVVPVLIALAVIAFGRFYRPIQCLTTSMKRWLLWCSILGLVIPLLILWMYPPNTDAALNALITRLLWPSRLMLMAAPAHTPTSGVAFVIAISVAANILVYLGIGFLVWTAASWSRRLRHNRSR